MASSMDIDRFQLKYLLSDSQDLRELVTDGWGADRAASSVARLTPARFHCCDLPRAARFVLALDRGRSCAQAFERLRSSRSLADHLRQKAGMDEAQSSAAIAQAKWYLREHFFQISQVVCHKLECHAASGTQIDQLGTDCLLAVTKYLRLDDVPLPAPPSDWLYPASSDPAILRDLKVIKALWGSATPPP